MASTLYIGYTAIGYGVKSVKGWVLGCPETDPTVENLSSAFHFESGKFVAF